MRIVRPLYVGLALLVFSSLLIRVGGLGVPYHQDEYKYAEAVNPQLQAPGAGIFHPPLAELMLTGAARVMGSDHLRLWPLGLSLINLVLLFVVVYRRYGERVAWWTAGLYVIMSYSVLSSLMLDIDGQMLPLMLLLSLLAYDHWRSRAGSWTAAIALMVALVAGFMVKLSFVIAMVALSADAVLKYRRSLSSRQYALVGVAAVVAGGGLTVILLSLPLLVPWFDLASTWRHAMSYVNFGSRNYLQILIQATKAVLYISPLPFALLVLARRTWWPEARLWWLLVGAALAFYLVVFDFAAGALDKYLMVLIIPLCVLGGLAGASIRDSAARRRGWLIGSGVGLGVALLLVGVSYLPHQVPPLYPKADWLALIMHGQWNFLMPFTGGSGPIGFYMSWLVMMLAFGSSVALAVVGWRSRWRTTCLVAVVIIGVVYNGLMITEYERGWHYGSAASVARELTAYVVDHDLPPVITYNDTAAYALRRAGKYANRFYVMGELSDVHRVRFNEHRGYYLIVELPRLNPVGGYVDYFSSCLLEYQAISGVVSGRIYDCRRAPPL